MELLTNEIRNTLLRNGRITEHYLGTEREPDFIPVVKLFTPDGSCTWLLTELIPDNPDIAFGLCDLGMGYPELGTVRISELEAVRGRLGLPIERDLHFAPRFTISVYAYAAHTAERIVEDEQSLARAAIAKREAEQAERGAP